MFDLISWVNLQATFESLLGGVNLPVNPPAQPVKDAK